MLIVYQGRVVAEDVENAAELIFRKYPGCESVIEKIGYCQGIAWWEYTASIPQAKEIVGVKGKCKITNGF